MFIGTKLYHSLDEEEQQRLNDQRRVMQEYGLILSERIAAFTN